MRKITLKIISKLGIIKGSIVESTLNKGIIVELITEPYISIGIIVADVRHIQGELKGSKTEEFCIATANSILVNKLK